MKHRLPLAALIAALAFPACESSPSGGTPTPASPTPAPTAAPIPTPPPDAVLPPLTVACTANPRAGSAPLPVDFTASADGGRRTYEYDWDFGDGGAGSNNPRPSHVYETPGDYEASVTVTDGLQQAACARSIRVARDVPPPPAMRRLEVTVSGPTPFVVAGPGTIACANPPGPSNTCAADFLDGTRVSVGAFRSPSAPGPPPVTWSGCDTVFPTNSSVVCQVVMDRDRVIAAVSQ
jgi:hypothetical protein